MQGLNTKYDDFIDGLMTSNAKENKDALHSELINKIPLSESYTNSITVAVGKQRSGKTRKIIKEIIKISKMHHETHMLLYINKTGAESDKTFESFKNLIKCPIVYSSQEECEDKLAELIQYKTLYSQILQAGTEEGFDPVEIETMKDVLQIEDYSRSYLHTLVLLDDIANSPLLKKETSYLNSLMTQCAHINMSFFLAIQYWKGLPAALKSQTSMIYLFGGFNKQQVRYMLTQIALEDPFDVVWEKYYKLKNRDFMSIDTIEGTYRITICQVKVDEKEKIDTKIKKKVNNQIKGIEEEEEHEDLVVTNDTTSMSPLNQWLNRQNDYQDAGQSWSRSNYDSTPVQNVRTNPISRQNDYSPRYEPYFSPEPVRDTRKDFSPLRKLEELDTNWDDIWNRNLEGKRGSVQWM